MDTFIGGGSGRRPLCIRCPADIVHGRIILTTWRQLDTAPTVLAIATNSSDQMRDRWFTVVTIHHLHVARIVHILSSMS